MGQNYNTPEQLIEKAALMRAARHQKYLQRQQDALVAALRQDAAFRSLCDVEQAQPEPEPIPAPWSKKHPHCLRCKTTERKHHARGYCGACLAVVRRHENPNRALEAEKRYREANRDKRNEAKREKRAAAPKKPRPPARTKQPGYKAEITRMIRKMHKLRDMRCIVTIVGTGGGYEPVCRPYKMGKQWVIDLAKDRIVAEAVPLESLKVLVIGEQPHPLPERRPWSLGDVLAETYEEQTAFVDEFGVLADWYQPLEAARGRNTANKK